MTVLTRLPRALVSTVMFVRPQRPDDHHDFEIILPQCQPLFVYAENGRDWVRWSLPKEVAARFGWGTMACVIPGCGCTEEGTDGGDVFLFDTAYSEVSWFLERTVTADD